ncbi:MAG: hypothetical protein AABZ53_14170 [Planctomycetota bacterium]
MARGRKRTFAGWSLIALGIAVTGIVFSSRWYQLTKPMEWGWYAGIWSGRVNISRFIPSYTSDPGRVYLSRQVLPSLSWAPSPPPQYSDKRAVNLWVMTVDRVTSPGPRTIWYTRVLLWPIALVLFAAGFVVRRWGGVASGLTQRGLCGECAYDLRGLPAGVRCPECGTLK